tara:strand:- start:149 stop:616 length:468 start_codon:yes stop_codon:yes gene_type:complete
MKFAATAQEEAEKINAQAGANEYGMTLVTDQEFWERQGIFTGEELALSVINQTYSDFYKEIHGFRPRHKSFTSVDEAQAAVDDLDRYYDEMIEQEEVDAKRAAVIEKEREELASLMPTPIERKYDKFPRQSGMGRRNENIKRLRTIIRKELLEIL